MQSIIVKNIKNCRKPVVIQGQYVEFSIINKIFVKFDNKSMSKWGYRIALTPVYLNANLTLQHLISIHHINQNISLLREIN